MVNVSPILSKRGGYAQYVGGPTDPKATADPKGVSADPWGNSDPMSTHWTGRFPPLAVPAGLPTP